MDTMSEMERECVPGPHRTANDRGLHFRRRPDAEVRITLEIAVEMPSCVHEKGS